MKKSKFVLISSLLMSATFVVTACGDDGGGGGGGDDDGAVFNFVPLFTSGKTDKLFAGTPEELEMFEYNTPVGTTINYTYQAYDAYDDDDVTVYHPSDYFTITPHLDNNRYFTLNPTKATLNSKNEPFYFTVTFKTSIGDDLYEKNVSFVIAERFDKANTGYNFSSDTEKKEEALGKLEEYAMKNYLTGITLFENGGYVRYSPRVKLGTETYITGYGFGLLGEGYLDYSKWTPAIGTPEAHPEVIQYLQQASSSDPTNISGWNAEGSQVADLYGYITSSYWGTKMNADKDGYIWYPVLAADNCPDPVPQDGKEGDTIHKVYRVYLKTGNIYYNYMGSVNNSLFHRRAVTLDDYLTAFQVLLTQSCNLFRGGEFAGDTSYGLKGAYSYFRKTKGATVEQAETHWNDMQSNGKLGVRAIYDDPKGECLEFEFLNPIDVFTAKYTLSSNLYSPIPKAFLSQVGNGNWIKGAHDFGTGSKNGFDDKGEGSILANTLSVGPYYLQAWEFGLEHYFKRDDEWFEYKNPTKESEKRYKIPGIHIRIVSAAQEDDTAIWSEFNESKFDSAGIPARLFKSVKNDDDYKTEGDSTFKLNVNSLDQESWNKMFDPSTPKYKKVKKAKQHYNCKPWMSNKHFLNGLFWSIDRKNFAGDRGVTASTNYFSDAYLSDPVAGESYNKSQAHIDAQNAFDPYLRRTGGYDQDKATAEFDLAVTELVANGDLSLGTKTQKSQVKIDIWWMYSTDESTYGEDIVRNFKEAFNGKVGEGLVELVVNQRAEAGDWQKVYNDHLQVGCFDLGFGAISGNTLSPLNFLEVLKSDNSSGFTLNWGTDTSIVDPDNPIVFEVDEDDPDNPGETIKVKKEWSFDALWSAADHGSIVHNGEAVDSVKYGFTSAPENNRMANGALMFCPFDFVDLDAGTSFEITRIEIVLVGAGSLSIDLSEATDKLKKWIRLTSKEIEGVIYEGIEITFDNEEVIDIDKDIDDPTKEKEYTFASFLNKELFFGLGNDKKIKPDTPKEELEDLKNPFSYNFYGDNEEYRATPQYWYIEVWYNITIKGSVPTENSYAIKMDDTSATPSERMRFAK